MAKSKTAKRTESRRKAQSAQADEQGGKFKVLKGSHIVGGKVYGRGSVVESDQDLEARFKNERRFRRVGPALQSAEEDEDEVNPAYNEVDDEVDVTAASKKAARKNPRGEHNRSMGALVDPEDEEDDDEDEGVVLPATAKAAKASARRAQAADDEEDEEEEEDTEDTEEDEEEAYDVASAESDLGDNVSGDFKKADKAQLAVFHNEEEGKYYVSAPDDPNAPVKGAKKGFATKKEVNEFLAKKV
jgi:hypothetical protein